MKKLLFLIVICISINANNNFALNETCKGCHPAIYDEFSSSQHSNSNIFKDEIHGAVWKKHPKNTKLQSYSCAKCHTPAASNLNKLVEKHNGISPDINSSSQNEGISCAYCHRIESIELGKIINKNIISKEKMSYFGTRKKHEDSPFHKIKTNSKHFNNGNVCIGCHSHKKNKHNLNVCSTNIDNSLDKSNCVSCHMPKVKGSVSILKETKEHTFHGFPGTHIYQNMLSKYVDIELLKLINSFDIAINNKSSHALSLHPMRVMELRVKLTRDGEIKEFQTKKFVRAIGVDGKASPPWKAKEVVENSAIKANEKRVVNYNYKLLKGDKLEIVIGYYLVDPKMLKGLDLEKSEVATKFYVFKTQKFEI